MVKIALYPGSFDPLTYGHLDIIQRSLKFCDKLVVAIGENRDKHSLFNIEEKKSLLESCLKENHIDTINRVEIVHFDGLLVHYAQKIGASIIIRGIRALSDFDFEFNLAGVNNKLANDIETVFLISSENHQFISSRFVKEIAMFGGDITKFVPKIVAEKLQQKIKDKNI
jgi:pantetheine-phosphate adenylyltransferase